MDQIELELPDEAIDAADEIQDDASLDEEMLGFNAESNQFRTACDATQSWMAYVHDSMQELLEFKDVCFSQSAIPSPVLLGLAIVVSKMFRDMSGMQHSLFELCRLVRLYAEPFDEKSVAVKKLHESYDRKARQLACAVKRLQHIHAQAVRVDEEKDMIRKWKRRLRELLRLRTSYYRVDDVFAELDRLVAMDINELGQDDTTQSGALTTHDPLQRPSSSLENEASDGTKKHGDDDAGRTSPRSAVERIPAEDDETKAKTPTPDEVQQVIERIIYRAPTPPLSFDADVQTEIKHFQDVASFTDTRRFGYTLHIRLFSPELKFEAKNLSATVKHSGVLKRTKILDPIRREMLATQKSKPAANSGKRSMIGSRRGQVGPTPASSLNETPSTGSTSVSFEKIHDDVELDLAYDPTQKFFGINQSRPPAEVKITLLQNGEMYAYTELDLPAIQNEGLFIATKPTQRSGDEFYGGVSAQIDAEREYAAESKKTHFTSVPALRYPLYSLSKEIPNQNVGTVQIAVYLSRRQLSESFERSSNTQHLNLLIDELTGVDLTSYARADIVAMLRGDEPPPPIQYRDIANSPASFVTTPVPDASQQIELEVARLSAQHEDELNSLRQRCSEELMRMSAELVDAEQRLAKLADAQVGNKGGAGTPRRSVSSKEGERKPPERHVNGLKGRTKRPTSEKAHKPKHIANLPNWGEDLPENFFTRLKMFAELNAEHRRDLCERHSETSRSEIEKQLATQYRLYCRNSEDMFTAIRDASLPSMFMPNRMGTVYNARAHQYFHSKNNFAFPGGGTAGSRLTQAPSIFKLPTLAAGSSPQRRREAFVSPSATTDQAADNTDSGGEERRIPVIDFFRMLQYHDKLAKPTGASVSSNNSPQVGSRHHHHRVMQQP